MSASVRLISLSGHSIEQLVGVVASVVIAVVETLIVGEVVRATLVADAAVGRPFRGVVMRWAGVAVKVVAVAGPQLGDPMTEVRTLLKHSVEQLVGASAVVVDAAAGGPLGGTLMMRETEMVEMAAVVVTAAGVPLEGGSGC